MPSHFLSSFSILSTSYPLRHSANSKKLCVTTLRQKRLRENDLRNRQRRAKYCQGLPEDFMQALTAKCTPGKQNLAPSLRRAFNLSSTQQLQVSFPQAVYPLACNLPQLNCTTQVSAIYHSEACKILNLRDAWVEKVEEESFRCIMAFYQG